MKTCTICGVEKPATLEHFGRRTRNTTSGLTGACRDCTRAANTAYRESWTPEERERHARRNRAKILLATYRITIEQYDEMLARQGGVCAICGRPPGKKRLAVDHDHSCCPGVKSCGGCVRGLLCTTCNTTLVGIEMSGAAPFVAYLEEHLQ